MEKQVKVVVSKKEPQNKHVLWLEQDPLHEISPKLYNNGEWQNLKTVNVPEELLDKVGKLNDSVKEFDREVENFNSDITSFRNSLITETQQRMAVDSSLGNRITSVTTTANNNKTSLDNLETTLNTNLANLKAKDAELEEAITNVKNDVVPKAVAEGIAKVVANAPEDLDTLKEIADYIASDKTNADKIITDISNLKTKDSTHDTEIALLKQKDTQLTNSVNANATNIAKNASDITANTEALAKQAEELENKAPKVGYAPDLKVDFAKELVGRGVAEPQEIGTIRPTGLISIGDGNATIEKVKGKSVVWNQLIQSEDITVRGDSTGEIQYEGGEYIAGHKYLSVFKGNTSANTINYRHRLTTAAGASYVDVTVDSTLKQFSNIFTANVGGRLKFRLIVLNTGLMSEDTIAISNASVYDLTFMFGAGNEPTTIEEFNARKPLNVSNDYNEGEIISYDAKELKSVGFNAFNGTYAKVIGGQQYHALGNITSIGFTTELGGETTEVTLDSEGMFTPTENGYVYAEGSDICIHLTHTYTPEHTTEYEEDILTLPDVKSIKDKDGNPLFPYGLLSAGSAYDEVTERKAIKRIGMVDMGDLNWDAFKHGYTGSFTNIPAKIRIAKGDNIVCEKYAIYLPKTLYNDATIEGIAGPQVGYWGSVFVVDSTLADLDSVKQAMRGVMLYYELKEPIEVDLTEPLNLTYDAWDFGTEELIADGATTPLNADIVYQFNAVDRIRENTANVREIEEEVATKQDELTLTVLDNGNIRIGNLQGQTKDFMPATPSGDPMHYAYEAIGAEYNATASDKTKSGVFGDTITHKAGHWYLNEVGDLTNAEMRNIYRKGYALGTNRYLESYFNSYEERTNFSLSDTAQSFYSFNYFLYYSTATTIALGRKNRSALAASIVGFMMGAKSCVKVLNVFVLRNITSANNVQNAFKGANALTYINVNGLKVSISFADSPLLSNASILYMINYEQSTSAITITLHADAYARAMADTSITTALTAHPNVSLASA